MSDHPVAQYTPIYGNSPPSLTQSESNSSASPPRPTTPLQRNRPRYPDLGRVPLHRRGTSGTYERLEDLLREAGYKETRIFTPETERTEKTKPENEKRSSIAGSVVGFFSGLIPAGSREVSGLQESATQDTLTPYSPPASPLADRSISSSQQGLGPTPKGKGSSLLRSPPLSPSLPPPPRTPSYAGLHHPRPSRASAYLRQMASQSDLQRPRSTPVYNNSPTTLYESEERGNGEGEEERQPPLPRTWLENVARAVLTGGVGYIGRPLSREQEQEPKSPQLGTTPALRQARSVIAKSNEHAAKYQSDTHQRQKSKTRSNHNRNPNLGLYRSRSGLSDRTNRTTTTRDLALTSASTFATSTSTFSTAPPLSTKSLSHHKPPPLLSRVGRTRSEKSVGEVSKTRVVCKSAPASRSNSMTRPSSSNERDEGSRTRRRVTDKQRRESKRGRKGKMERRGNSAGAQSEFVPSLSRTRTEGDELWKATARPSRVVTDPSRGARYLRGVGGGAMSDLIYSSESEYESTDDDDEGELDLARMLVNPKRQNSIKSLRKHLIVEGTASASLLAITERSTTTTTNTATAGGGNFGSANSRTFRDWMASLQSPEDDWEAEIHGTAGGWGWPSSSRRRPQSRRRGSHEDVDDAASFLEFLQEDRKPSHTRYGTNRSTTSNRIRTALPTSFVQETT